MTHVSVLERTLFFFLGRVVGGRPFVLMSTIDVKIRQPLEWIFDHVLDEDGSGHIEAKEANMVAKYTGDKDPAFWEKMLEMDTDGDGKISKEECVCTLSRRTTAYVAPA